MISSERINSGDIFSRVVFGARVSIRIGFVAVGLAITLGSTIGTISG